MERLPSCEWARNWGAENLGDLFKSQPRLGVEAGWAGLGRNLRGFEACGGLFDREDSLVSWQNVTVISEDFLQHC